MEAIGVAGSLISIGDALLKGCKLIHSLKVSFSECPAELDRLCKAMERLERITTEIKILAPDEDDWKSSSLSLDWKEHLDEIDSQVGSFNAKLRYLRNSLNIGSKRRAMASRFRKFLIEENFNKYEDIFSRHQDNFQLILAIISLRRSQSMFEEIKRQGELIALIKQQGVPKNITYSSISYQPGAQASGYFITDGLKAEALRKLSQFVGKDAYELEAKKIIRSAVQKSPTLDFKAIDYIESSPKGMQRGIQLPCAVTLKALEPKIKYVFSCRFFNVNLPLGIIHGVKVRRSRVTKSLFMEKRENEWSIRLSLYPLCILTKIVFRILLRWSSNGSFTFQPNVERWNTSSELIRCFDEGDADGLYKMFSAGQATPRDLIPPWGNTLIYEAVSRYALGNKHMIHICEILIQHGADANLPNQKRRTPLIQCSKLMLQGRAMNERMLPLASLLLESGSDLSYRDEDGYSSCMLIFQSKMGLDYLQDHVCHFWDLETFSNFDNGDLWLISSIARCTPRLLRKLELQNKELRTSMEISSSIRPRIENIVELTAEQQVAWVRAAAPKDRVPFMQTLCSCGTLAMAKPFIDSGLDLDEIVGDSWGMTYLRSAANAGNLEVVKALIEAGAKMDQKALYWLSDHLCTSVLDEFLWRWRYISLGKPVLGRGTPSIKSELWITDTILSHPDFTGPNALLLSIWPGVDRDIVLSIMKHGIGRRDGQPPVTRLMKVWGSEVIQATKTRLPYLKDMLHYGLGVDCEDAMGCTAVLFAIDLAAEKELALLINAGANLTRRTRYGLTPLELAKSNLEADHPRPEQRAFNSIWFQARKMTLEQDQRMYHMLSKAIHVQRRLPLCEPTIVVPRDVHIQ